MKRFILPAFLALTLGLSGCFSAPTTHGSRLLPWNWFSSDSTVKVKKLEKSLDDADAVLLANAQRNSHAAVLSIGMERDRQIATTGAPSVELLTASDYAARSSQSLDAANGFLDFNVEHELADMVRLRNSKLAEDRAKGDGLLQHADTSAARAAGDKTALTGKLDDAHTAVGAEQQRGLIAEEKLNKFWFYVWCIAGAWLFMQFLPALSAIFPALAPVAHVAGTILAPAVQTGYNRVRTAMGEALHAVEKVSAEAAQAGRTSLDAPLTVADQRFVAQASALKRNA